MGEFPPDGVNLRMDSTPDLLTLCKALTSTVCCLRDMPTGEPLLRYDDWLEHDGLLFPRGKVTFSDLLSIVSVPRNLLEVTPDDFAVRVGIAAPDRSWYLRFRADLDAEDCVPEGSFDVTVPHRFHDECAMRLLTECHVLVQRDPARDYYRRISNRT